MTAPGSVEAQSRATSRALALCLALAVSTFACGAPVRSVPPGATARVRKIEFVGVTRFSHESLLAHLYMDETRRRPLSPDYWYDEALVAVDLRRIEDLYHAYGYPQARVRELSREVDEDGRWVGLRIRVDEGEPLRLSSLRFDWQPADSLEEGERRAVEAVAELTVGQPFEVPALNRAVGSLRLELQRRGFPLAKVSSQARTYAAAGRAELELRVVPGERARIGSVRVEGLVGVPADKVAVETRFALGQPYSPALVQQIENAVKGLQVFRWVSALPPAELRDGEAEVVVRVSEADPQSLRMGAQLAFETTRWQEQLSARYSHSNLFGRLTRLDLDAMAGWAQLPDPFRPDLQGPVALLRPTFTHKGLVEDHLLWTLQPSYRIDVREGYRYQSPSTLLAVARWFQGILRLELGHHLQRVDFFDIDPTLDRSSSLLGRDFRDPFLLSYLGARAQVVFADSVVKPSRGVLFDATADLAGGALGGDYDFLRSGLGLRVYQRPWRRLVLAARAELGLIQPYGAEGGAPFSFRYYLGGANTMRGWGSRRLSPRLLECAADDASCSSIPVGGYSMVNASLEARLLLFGELYAVGFVDLGDVQAAALSVRPEEWHLSAGPGLRYDSPLGLVRLDLGLRLNQAELYPDEPGWALHFGLGETF